MVSGKAFANFNDQNFVKKFQSSLILVVVKKQFWYWYRYSLMYVQYTIPVYSTVPFKFLPSVNLSEHKLY